MMSLHKNFIFGITLDENKMGKKACFSVNTKYTIAVQCLKKNSIYLFCFYSAKSPTIISQYYSQNLLLYQYLS